MARTTTRSSAKASTRARSQPRPAERPGFRALRWLLNWSRPRTASEFLALLLAVLGVATFLGTAAITVARRQSPGTDVAWCLPIFFGAGVARLSPWWLAELNRMTADRARKYIGVTVIMFVALCVAIHLLASDLGGRSVYPLLGPFSSGARAIAALLVLAVVGFATIFDVPVWSWANSGFASWHRSMLALRERHTLQSTRVEDLPAYFPEVDRFDPESEAVVEQPAARTVGRGLSALTPAPARPSQPSPVPKLPPIETFNVAVKGKGPSLDLEQISRRIEETLASFGVRARVVDHHAGPVVTQFDVQPERGVKVKSITSLQNDLALALAAPTIRIQAPVPGKAVIGIEIPNASATTVSLRELLESDAFDKVKSPLAVVLGKDVAGNPAVIDLARMPHLLIAGATGSGKSVCVNALISCLLYRNTPEDVRLMMIDPKMVELTVYNGAPHLLSPVVTQMDRVVGVLQWALREMERRYQLFADNTVRNIGRYNEKMIEAGKARLPYIVIVIDELADLMMVAPEDVEDAVCRLAQLARAAGMHLVIATQRPSVDVVTGLIKANFPARVAFAMSSQVDSRTILDTAGAEKLLGRGDMLYQPPDAPKPVRLQGAFLSDQEIERLVEFWQRSPLQAAIERIKEEEFAAAEKTSVHTDDDLLSEAIHVVREFQHASVSLLQRRLRIGYSRAARVMDQLEAHGVVGPADGSKQRPVLPPPDEGPPRD